MSSATWQEKGGHFWDVWEEGLLYKIRYVILMRTQNNFLLDSKTFGSLVHSKTNLVYEDHSPGQDRTCGTSTWQSPADRWLNSLPVAQKLKEGHGHTREVLPEHHSLTLLQGVTGLWYKPPALVIFLCTLWTMDWAPCMPGVTSCWLVHSSLEILQVWIQLMSVLIKTSKRKK